MPTQSSKDLPSKISLVLADVDGTLVKNDKSLTPRAIEAIHKLHERGVLFAITSARPPRGLSHLVGPLQITTPIAGFNGGLVVAPDTGDVLQSLPLPDALAPQIVDLLDKHNVSVWVFKGNDWYVRDPNGPHVDHENHTVQFPPIVVPNFDGVLTGVSKIVGVSDDFDAVAKAENDAQAMLDGAALAVRSQPYYLDITHPDANKGAVARFLRDRLHVPREELLVIGDQANDVAMFKEAGFAIAMGNAPENVKSQANATTDTNENDGFAKAIQKYVLQENQ